MSETGRGAPARSATADREIVVSRVIGAPRELVFEAFTQVRHLSQWWGPEGFTTTTRSFEFRVGGAWDFVMHGPDGTDYSEWVTWTEMRTVFPTKQLRDEAVEKYHAIEGGKQTLSSLAAYVTEIVRKGAQG